MIKGKTYLFGSYPPPYGGIATYVQTLAYHLARLNRPYELRVFGDFPESLPRTFSGFWRAFASITRHDVCFDHSHFALGYAKRPLLALILLKILRRFRWVVVIHNGSIPDRYVELTQWDRIGLRLALWLADDWITVSREVETWFVQKFKRKRSIRTIPSLLPLAEQTPVDLPLDFQDFRARYDRLILAVGIFTAPYGFHLAVEAVERLRQVSSQSIGLVLVDGGVVTDAEYKSRILDNPSGWILSLSQLPYPLLSQLMKHCDVFVRPLRSEAYGLSRIEALWNGTPVVATNVGETRGMLLFDYGDVTTLCQQIERAFTMTKDQINTWAELYTQEAEENLQQWLQYLP